MYISLSNLGTYWKVLKHFRVAKKGQYADLIRLIAENLRANSHLLSPKIVKYVLLSDVAIIHGS